MVFSLTISQDAIGVGGGWLWLKDGGVGGGGGVVGLSGALLERKLLVGYTIYSKATWSN